MSFPYGDGCITRPLEEPEDIVSNESAPCSIELQIGGRGEILSAGAKNPFFVAVEDFEPIENRPLALGAEATRRMKREAVAPIDLGLSGPFVRNFEVSVVVVTGHDNCEVFPACCLILDIVAIGPVFSDIV